MRFRDRATVFLRYGLRIHIEIILYHLHLLKRRCKMCGFLAERRQTGWYCPTCRCSPLEYWERHWEQNKELIERFRESIENKQVCNTVGTSE